MTEPTERVSRWWGIGDPDAVFGGGDRTVCPWRSARRLKGQPLVEPGPMAAVLAGSPYLADVDPRQLRCTQTWVLHQHVAWYRTGQWERTGTTSADRGKAHNRYPLIYEDQWGDLVIAAGHHRSMAALIEGRPVRARVLRPEGATAVAVLPHLFVTSSGTGGSGATSTDDAHEAAKVISSGETSVVPSLEIATKALQHLGMASALVQDRLEMASHGRCLVEA
jgi:hypothetical protein